MQVAVSKVLRAIGRCMVQQTDAIGIAALDPDLVIFQHLKVVPLFF